MRSSNPDLKAVTSKNATFGVIFEPLQQFNASVDYYWIQLNNDIISASAAGGLGASFLQLVRGAPQSAAGMHQHDHHRDTLPDGHGD